MTFLPLLLWAMVVKLKTNKQEIQNTIYKWKCLDLTNFLIGYCKCAQNTNFLSFTEVTGWIYFYSVCSQVKLLQIKPTQINGDRAVVYLYTKNPLYLNIEQKGIKTKNVIIFSNIPSLRLFNLGYIVLLKRTFFFMLTTWIV